MSDEPRFDDAALKRYVDDFLAPKVPKDKVYVEVEYRFRGSLRVEVGVKVGEHWQFSGDCKWAFAQGVEGGVKVRGSW